MTWLVLSRLPKQSGQAILLSIMMEDRFRDGVETDLWRECDRHEDVYWFSVYCTIEISIEMTDYGL